MLIGLTKGSDKLRFSYDAAGQVQAVDFNGTYYYYLRNGQGDVVKLIDGIGATVVEYTYDSWGKPLSCTGTLATSLGELNPFRYRGYVYDEETQWYYLKSRYYDPETCRFISADVYLSTGQGVLGHNCYAYCLNNPANMFDTIGHRPAKGAISSDGDEEETNYTFVENQHDISIAGERYGLFGTIGNNGCGLIALYNVRVALHDCDCSFETFRSNAQMWPMRLAGGLWGTDPLFVDGYLYAHYGYANVDFMPSKAKADKYDVLVFCCTWRKRDTIKCGGHYFIVTNNGNGTFTVHNGDTIISGIKNADEIWAVFQSDDNYVNDYPFIWGIHNE